jgi:hypothetical protein
MSIRRGTLTVTTAKSKVVYNHVTRFSVKAGMIEVTTYPEGADRSKRFGVKGWLEYEYD